MSMFGGYPYPTADRHDSRAPESPPSFTCPECRATSYNPNDIVEGYCGRCHDWTGVRRDGYARQVDHLDGDPRNNDPANLAIVDAPEVQQ